MAMFVYGLVQAYMFVDVLCLFTFSCLCVEILSNTKRIKRTKKSCLLTLTKRHSYSQLEAINHVEQTGTDSFLVQSIRVVRRVHLTLQTHTGDVTRTL
ncbi:hypothetical protein AALO_G00089530 [Alosa alosa]|uniref:Secreted protein n=1 Tax=Alosa alosa TaxID=278164 RepID=A0AAV6GR51_9TELE|nr:hypothetical protein AALO_G00089530 [Alosa alosa]